GICVALEGSLIRKTWCFKEGEKEMQHNYSYQSALAASERIGCEIDDIIGGDKKLDFTKPLYDPNSKPRMSICHHIMKMMSRPGDLILNESGNGDRATILIRYRLKTKNDS